MAEDLDFAVRYPFSSEAKLALESRNLELNGSMIAAASERIKSSLKGGSGKSSAIHDEDKINEIASYAAARMLLSFLNNRFITNKFAVAESKRASGYLERDEESAIEKISSELSISVEKDGKNFLIIIPQYLMSSPRAVPYKLINREIHDGKVLINQHERVRLMEEAIRKRMEKVPLLKNAPPLIKDAAQKLISELPKEDLPQVKVKPGDYPPCVMKLLDSVKKHENLNHQARWYLCVYLMATGLADEGIISLYSNLPDFSERITKYQVEHARKKGYSVPSCVTITTWGFCVANCRIGSPLNWQGKGGKG